MDIHITQLHKIFNKSTVLNNIEVSVSNKRCIGILGPSGSGKTTLLRIIAGLEKPDRGEISINAHKIPYEDTQKIDASRALRAYRMRLGVVFQSFNLLPHLSALHNISLPLIKVHGWTKAEAEEKAQELLKRFSLDIHGHKHAHQLSGGQKQRIAICRAIAPSPEFLLFDEPTSALDPDFIKEVLDTIKELRSFCDFIIVTHHIGFSNTITDHILFLDHGNVVESDSLQKIYNNPSHPSVQRFFNNIVDM